MKIISSVSTESTQCRRMRLVRAGHLALALNAAHCQTHFDECARDRVGFFLSRAICVHCTMYILHLFLSLCHYFFHFFSFIFALYCIPLASYARTTARERSMNCPNKTSSFECARMMFWRGRTITMWNMCVIPLENAYLTQIFFLFSRRLLYDMHMRTILHINLE